MEVIYLDNTRKKKDGGNNRFCERHWPEYMNEDPHAVFIIMLVENELLKIRRFINCAIDNKTLDKAYDRFSPVCCFLGNEAMDEIYERAAYVHHKESMFD